LTVGKRKAFFNRYHYTEDGEKTTDADKKKYLKALIVQFDREDVLKIIGTE